MQTVDGVMRQESPPKAKLQILEKLAQERRESDPELAMVVSKEVPYVEGVKPDEVLRRHLLPGISSAYRRLLRTNGAELNPRLVKDGHVYVFRGDYPGLEQKGIFSFAYHRWNVNLDQMLELLKDEPLHSHSDFEAENKLEELMWMQSNGGYENFLSASASFRIARIHPKYKDNLGAVYVIRVPVERAFKNYASVCSKDEEEILIPDFVLPDSVVAVIDSKEARDLDVRGFM